MLELRFYDISKEEWTPIREELTTGIRGITLLHNELKGIHITLTEVQPGGSFEPHIDSYDHVLFCLSGAGVARISSKEIKMMEGRVIEIPSGIEHSYENTGTDTLVLFTMNITQ